MAKGGEGHSAQAGRVDDALLSLRERVLRAALNIVALAMPAMSAVVLISEMGHGPLGVTDIALGVYTLSFPLLRLVSPRLGFQRSAVALLALLLTTAFLVEWRGGVSVGSVMANALVILLSALFFGRGGGAVGLSLVLVLFGMAALVDVMGPGVPIPTYLWDPTTPDFWVRQGLALTLFGGALAIAQVYVVERLAREAADLRELASREHAQRLALEEEREQRLLAQKALDESRRTEALARLAGGIAHDFNNALTVILGTAESITFARSLDAARGGARDIIDASRRAAELTRQLLTLGRRQVSKPRAVHMEEFLGRFRCTLPRVLPSHISVRVDVEPGDPVASVDPAELERALLNLSVNARDAMSGGGELAVKCRTVTIAHERPGLDPGRYVQIIVSDDGEGMTEETLSHVFEPFFTTKAPGDGTGLGLATVRGFVMESGGDIRVTSARGAGTTVEMLLPEPEEPGKSSALPSRPKEPVVATGAGRRVLVVEDRSDVREAMLRALEGSGFAVAEACDGDAALALLTGGSEFSLLCIDGMMPGVATGQVIEQAERLHPEMKILLCSGYLPEDLLRRGVARDRYAFLQKPFSGQELVSTVQGLFGTGSSALV